MGELERVAVLEWNGWTNFLLPRVLDDLAVRHETDPFREMPTGQFEELCRSVDGVCFHINLSDLRRLPLGVADLAGRFAARGLYVVNGAVTDIRKSALHEHLEAIGLPSLRAPRSGPDDERLFVKTELNYGGETERMVPPDLRASGVRRELISPEIEATTYRVARRGDLEESVWRDPSLVVERYMSNEENSFYRAYFSGQQVILVEAFDHAVIQKMSGDPRDRNFVTTLGPLADGSDDLPIHSALRHTIVTFLRRTPIDFGCIDIVHDGRESYYVVDLNSTPSAPDGSPNGGLNLYLRLGLTEERLRRCW